MMRVRSPFCVLRKIHRGQYTERHRDEYSPDDQVHRAGDGREDAARRHAFAGHRADELPVERLPAV